MGKSRTYEYARLWVPLYDVVALAVNRPVYLVEADDGFEGFVAEKNTTLMGVLNDLGRRGWRVSTHPERVTSPSPELQMLVDATLDEIDAGPAGDPGGGIVAEFDVYGMRRRR